MVVLCVNVGSHYSTADEPRRLRKPDLSRVEASSTSDHWQPPAKSPSYHYGPQGSSSGQYPGYLKPDTKPHGLDSGQFQFSSSDDNSQHRGKTFGPQTAGSGALDGGGIRDGLTEARPRKPADDENTGQGCC